MLKRAALVLSLMLGLTSIFLGQTPPTNLQPGSLEAKALAFFEQLNDRSFDDYLKRVRLPKVLPAFKAELLARITKDEEVRVSDRMKSELATLAQVLKFHEREDVVGVKVLSLPHAFVGFQGRAILLISEKAINLLAVEELQAVVAHELGHEYFWSELMEARQQKRHEVIREIELQCDGIAVITLHRLGIDPAKLISALGKIRTFNTRISIDPLYHPNLGERGRFVRAMSELVQRKAETFAGSIQ
jgi:hypothetical protein